MKLTHTTILGSVFAGALTLANPVMASEIPGYLYDIAGQPVTSGSGECVHTGAWNDSMPTCPEPNVVFEKSDGLIQYTIDDSEFFGFDKVSLSDSVKTDLNSLVGSVEETDLIHGITITGHADTLGPAPYNAQLAQRRADAVKNYLVEKGIPADRINVQSDGSSNPLVTCTGTQDKEQLISCLAPNRRVDIQALVADNVEINTFLVVPPGEE
ncbi:MAG: OmpA family protein [Candidatus Thiodiazotropha sp.]|jgi:OmpA-OmpF porin, OOP family